MSQLTIIYNNYEFLIEYLNSYEFIQIEIKDLSNTNQDSSYITNIESHQVNIQPLSKFYKALVNGLTNKPNYFVTITPITKNYISKLVLDVKIHFDEIIELIDTIHIPTKKSVLTNFDTKINQLEQKIEEKYEKKILALENKLQELETFYKTQLETLQTKFVNSGIEYNILVGYTGVNNPVYCNYNFNKEFKSLPYFLLSCNCKILLKLSVFKQLSTYYNFNCVALEELCKQSQHPPHKEWESKINFVTWQEQSIFLTSKESDKKFKSIKHIIITCNQNKYTFPILDKLINILNECNIKLTLYDDNYELYLDETNRINYRLITNSMINDFRGMNTGRINETSNNFYISIEQ